MAKIYTRTGDTGDTGLIGGGRARKDNLRVAAYGDVDELNAAIGLARAELSQALPAVETRIAGAPRPDAYPCRLLVHQPLRDGGLGRILRGIRPTAAPREV